MTEATIIYPHQLFLESPALAPGRVVYLVEEPLLLTHNPIHRQKLIFHKLTLDMYERKLKKQKYKVERLDIHDCPKTQDVFTRLSADGITHLHILDTHDTYLEDAIAESGLKRVWYETPLFLLEKEDAITRYEKSGRFMAKFYKALRKDRLVMVDAYGEPDGGQWSFDEDNRKKIPKNTPLPAEPVFLQSKEITAAITWSETVPAEQYGNAGCWMPYTHEAAAEYLQTFLEERFALFGDYEDALHTDGGRLWHSTLSPLINVGLLTPQQVLDGALAYAQVHHVPLNSLEGFIRQILGWREFIRASYECEGSAMRSQNFWKHERPLPQGIWEAKTGLMPLDLSIEKALSHGYNHHIERLMVLGNFMLLSQTHPDEVYRWFMGLYIDAYDWVMVPNVYGMSQFADGGSFATKPYISGSNYLRKMSNYPKGDWEETWTALYWHFIETHLDFFKSNHRLSMMPRMLAKMDKEKRETYQKAALAYFNTQKD